ncbi:hypothetical protein HKD37_12G034676 [Glycine soja]
MSLLQPQTLSFPCPLRLIRASSIKPSHSAIAITITTATVTASCSTSTIASARTTTIIADIARDGSVTGVIVILDTVFACAVGVFEFVVGIIPFAVTGASIFPHLLSIRVSTAFAFAHRADSASAFAIA